MLRCLSASLKGIAADIVLAVFYCLRIGMQAYGRDFLPDEVKTPFPQINV